MAGRANAASQHPEVRDEPEAARQEALEWLHHCAAWSLFCSSHASCVCTFSREQHNVHRSATKGLMTPPTHPKGCMERAEGTPLLQSAAPVQAVSTNCSPPCHPQSTVAADCCFCGMGNSMNRSPTSLQINTKSLSLQGEHATTGTARTSLSPLHTSPHPNKARERERHSPQTAASSWACRGRACCATTASPPARWLRLWLCAGPDRWCGSCNKTRAQAS